jgi:lon-related putative ATP-dependent protease
MAVWEVPFDRLRARGDDLELGCETTADLAPLEIIIGQARAVRALQFGLAIKDPGFNIYVAGLPGTGRTTAVKTFLDTIAKDKPVPDDLCYVNSFRDPYEPNALTLPPGRATTFQGDMQTLIENVQGEIRRAFESEEYALKRQETVRSFQRQRDDLFSELNDRAREQGFGLQASPVGLLTIPLKDGKPLGDDEFQALSAEEREAISDKREALQDEVKAAIRQARALEKAANQSVEDLDHQVAHFGIDPLIDELKEAYRDCEEVPDYLDQVRDDILENLAQFRVDPQQQQEQDLRMPGAEQLPFRRYEVNVLVDNSGLAGAPVIIELNPVYNNLFGRVIKEPQFGTLLTDFTMIRAGSLHRANGGYLVIPVPELIRAPLSWDSLKRALRNQQAAVEEPAERLGYIATKSLRPEPTPLDVKVVLIGDSELYYLLSAYDPDFQELFKVKADFDSVMERSEENILDYASFVCTLCCSEDLKHLDRSAMSKVIEHGSRLAGDQTKLSTKFGELSDVVREASYYAGQEGAEYVSGSHVKKAIDERHYRSNLVQERIQEMIERGSIMIDVDRAIVGQVNGLSVSGLGDITFGRPSRITVSVGLGRGGLVDIEREAKLGGPLHTKGVLILSGYLMDQYAQDKPLSLSARLVFEQSYGGVDGDSASSTELYALLSSLSGVPIKQGIAVTGSVNQKGQVQAIGGVNAKVEGFFAVCEARGLTGEQGVLIPESNVPNLMLKEEVVDAVREGKFHIWAVQTIDEGIEVLTGVKAGRRLEDGGFEAGTVHHLVDQRLRMLAQSMKEYGESGEGPKIPRQETES